MPIDFEMLEEAGRILDEQDIPMGTMERPRWVWDADSTRMVPVSTLQDQLTVASPWGYWEMPSGIWHHNTFIDMPKEEQRRINNLNGYPC